MSEEEKQTLICSWCKKVIREGDDATDVSHGICPECRERIFDPHYEEEKVSDCGVEQLV